MQPQSTEFLPPVHTPLSIGFLPKTYIQPSEFISAAYIQPPSIGFSSVTYTLTGIRSTLAIYITSASYTQLLMGYAHSINHSLFRNNPPVIIITTSIDHGRKLSNLVKIYIDETKYSGYNNNFIFKLAIFYNICSKADVSLDTKMKIFPIILKDLALDYYYFNISISTVALNFDQVCNSIRNYFEGIEYKQSILSK